MEIETKARKMGGSIYITVPANLVKWLDIEEETTLVLQDEQGKHGKFFSGWVKKND